MPEKGFLTLGAVTGEECGAKDRKGLVAAQSALSLFADAGVKRDCLLT